MSPSLRSWRCRKAAAFGQNSAGSEQRAQFLSRRYRLGKAHERPRGGRGLSRVDIDRDGKSVWVFDRCETADWLSGLQSRSRSSKNSMRPGKLVFSFGKGMVQLSAWHLCRCPGQSLGVGRPRGQEQRQGPYRHEVFSRRKNCDDVRDVPGVPGNDEKHFNAPSDILIAPNGDIFVADGHGGDTNARIVKFDKTGKFLKTWGKKGTGPANWTKMRLTGSPWIPHGKTLRRRPVEQSPRDFRPGRKIPRRDGGNSAGQAASFIDKKDIIYAPIPPPATKTNPGYKQGIRNRCRVVRDGKVTQFIPWNEGKPRSPRRQRFRKCLWRLHQHAELPQVREEIWK